MKARDRNTQTRDKEEEETRRAHADKMKRKQEYLDRKQESGEDTREYYATKRSLGEFKDEMLKGLQDAELKDTCLFCKPKEPKQKEEIKAVLD